MDSCGAGSGGGGVGGGGGDGGGEDYNANEEGGICIAYIRNGLSAVYLCIRDKKSTPSSLPTNTPTTPHSHPFHISSSSLKTLV